MSLLITHGYFLQEDPKGKKIMKPYPPLDILYISSFLQKSKIEHDVFDSTFSNFETLTQQILQKKYKQVGIYTNLLTKISVMKVIAFIKSKDDLKDTTIILFGPDIGSNTEEYIEHGANMIVISEAEETMKDLINTLNIPVNPFLDKVASIAFKNYFGKIVFTSEREATTEIDELPFPNRDRIDIKKYLSVWRSKHNTNVLNVNTQRGQNNIQRSAQNVCNELEEIKKKYYPDTIKFDDDVFTMSHQWLTEFAVELLKINSLPTGRQVKIRYECITRADKMNDAIILDLKKTGCYRIWINAKPKSMDYIADLKIVQEMLLKAKSAGFETGTSIVLGNPGETEADIFKTLEHLLASNPTYFTIHIANPAYYYTYAARFIANEVKYSQLDILEKILSPIAWKYKLKSILAQERMQRYSKSQKI